MNSSLGLWCKIYTWGFPKIRGTILGVPIIRIIVFWGLYWGPLVLGNYHLSGRVKCIGGSLLKPAGGRI